MMFMKVSTDSESDSSSLVMAIGWIPSFLN